ncbi:Pantothenate synthetase [Thermodesulfobium narugense DSM 14796]|uniref:Pantothenate synthetase n=1 Tax=Thermodesulfobium narugense DSM 14796 TaxID=747365 RepID=M1E6D3_9BACT|nr:pantoate--beta-alanine ligase [Thermodesulfobium narugense]AEE13940.1 Pantothenate synthetase [Thermodesulfobium narugense DSM 14796]
MRVFFDKKSLRKFLEEKRSAGKTVSLVPTMGYLHEGHISLVRRARGMSGIVVVSIFVNPIQFGPNEDLDRYPRDLGSDLRLLDREGVDAVFCPNPEEMYPEEQLCFVEVKGLQDKLCGLFRPGHFKGVCTVVAKLFNIVQPDFAHFGEKDFQQLVILRKMVKDLDFPIKIVPSPIVRDSDNLALSSRNSYLTPDERKIALNLSKELFWIKEKIESGNYDIKILEDSKARLQEKGIKLDYLQAVNIENLNEKSDLTPPVAVLLAGWIGKVRLIDNIIVES